uniref:DUF4371 domain-containing protein n=1 Tax=Oryza meridionalis TaxID=40149 RepID=A0A0E0C1Q6_9ORYZ
MSKRTLLTYYSSSSNTNTTDPPLNNEIASLSKRPRAEFSHMDIIGDPGEWKPIDNYPPKIRDQEKRAYALSGPTQPDICTFPRKPEKFGSVVFAKEDVIRFLIEQGDPFHGHDETNASLNKGKFREMVNWYKDKVPQVKDAYDKGNKNCQMLSHDIQQNLTKACVEEVTAVIMNEIGHRNFSMLIDESRDVSIKEQMGVILRFVNDEGKVMERFFGLDHIERCTAVALKEALVAIIDVLEIVKKDSTKPTFTGGAFGLMGKMQSFDFVFIMHLMIDILSITDDMSCALQRKDQNIVEAMNLIIDVKDLLQDMRENGWEPLMNRVASFCVKHEIKVPKMVKEVNERGTSTRRKYKVTIKHYYHVEIFLAAIDAILAEMNRRFSEVSSDLLVCMSAFNPRISFSNFDVDKLVRLLMTKFGKL